MSPNSPLPKRVLGAFGRFFRKEDGVVTIEGVLMLPLLFWSMWTSYTFFDGYRQGALNLKAAYAVADILSREKETVTDQYVTSMYDLQKFMIAERSDLSLRISFVSWHNGENLGEAGHHEVEWSCVRGQFVDGWTNGTINQISDRIPVMADGATMILVETRDHYVRPFDIGLGSRNLNIDKFIFTQPRGYTYINGPDSCKENVAGDPGADDTVHDDTVTP